MKVSKERITLLLNRVSEYSLYILIFSLPFSNTIIEICAITAIGAWFFKKLLSGKKGLRLTRTELNLPLSIFYLIAFLSIFWSTYPDLSVKAFIRKLSEYILLYFVVLETVSEKRIIRNIAISLAASLFLICIDGLYQWLIGFDFIRGRTMYGLEKVEIEGMWSKFKGFDSIFRRTIEGNPIGHLVRISASFKFPNGLSSWLLVVSFPFISLALFYRKSSRLRGASLILASLSILCLLLTYTRGALISFTVVLALMLLLRGGRLYRALFFALLLLLVVLALVLPEEIKTNIGLSNILSGSTSTWHRIKMWTSAWRMFMDRPFLGQGLNTFMANYERFRLPTDTTIGVWYAHNCYLQIAAEIGIFGLLAFLWMSGRMAGSFFKSWRLIKDEFLRYLYFGLFFGIGSFLLHITVEMSLYSLQLAVLFYFSLGLLMAIKRVGCES